MWGGVSVSGGATRGVMVVGLDDSVMICRDSVMVVGLDDSVMICRNSYSSLLGAFLSVLGRLLALALHRGAGVVRKSFSAIKVVRTFVVFVQSGKFSDRGGFVWHSGRLIRLAAAIGKKQAPQSTRTRYANITLFSLDHLSKTPPQLAGAEVGMQAESRGEMTEYDVHRKAKWLREIEYS